MIIIITIIKVQLELAVLQAQNLQKGVELTKLMLPGGTYREQMSAPS